MQFRLFDPSNNQTIQHVTHKVAVTSGTTEKPLLMDSFHSHIGLLTLHIEPTNGPITILAEHDPNLKSWLADSSGNILIRGPILLHGGLLHFRVEILTMDNDGNSFTPQQSPKFDASLSLGDVYQSNWKYQNQNYNTTVISYYDKLNNVNFQPINKLFTWSMPFDYNLTRIKRQPIFVHEEMRLPKSWKGFGDLTRYNATVFRSYDVDISMSSAAYYDYMSRLIRSMLKIPDSGPFQSQSQPSSSDLAVWTVRKMRDNIINIITKRLSK
jgi:hypothetical protein